MICQLTGIFYFTFHIFKFCKETLVAIGAATRQLEVRFVRTFGNFQIADQFKRFFVGGIKTPKFLTTINAVFQKFTKMLLNFMNPFTRKNSIFSATQIIHNKIHFVYFWNTEKNYECGRSCAILLFCTITIYTMTNYTNLSCFQLFKILSISFWRSSNAMLISERSFCDESFSAVEFSSGEWRFKWFCKLLMAQYEVNWHGIFFGQMGHWYLHL